MKGLVLRAKLTVKTKYIFLSDFVLICFEVLSKLLNDFASCQQLKSYQDRINHLNKLSSESIHKL